MRFLLALLLLPAAAWAKPTVVTLSLSDSGCRYTVTLNGVDLVHDEDADIFTMPVNPWLAGKDNTVDLTVKPVKGKKECEAQLKVEEMDRANWRTHVLALGKVDGKTGKASFSFESRIDALTAWKKAAPFKDEKALKAYAVKLADLARTGKWDLWLVEARPKYEELAKAFEAPRAALMEADQNAFSGFEEILPPLKASQVVLEPILDGRLWRLRIKKHETSLFVVQQGDTEEAMEIIVGQVDGELRVVR